MSLLTVAVDALYNITSVTLLLADVVMFAAIHNNSTRNNNGLLFIWQTDPIMLDYHFAPMSNNRKHALRWVGLKLLVATSSSSATNVSIFSSVSFVSFYSGGRVFSSDDTLFR